MDYFRYWGKAKPDARGAPCHLLPFHSLDVAAVGWHLLAAERPLTQHLAVRLDLSPEVLRRLLVFALGLHDLGKFARAFQMLASPPGVDLMPPVERKVYHERHDRLGAMLWRERYAAWLADGTLRWPAEPLTRRERSECGKTLEALMVPMFGHHGIPVEAGPALESAFSLTEENGDDTQAARAFTAAWADIANVDWPHGYFFSKAWRQTLQSLNWTLAGWAVLADWIGSNCDHFPYRAASMTLGTYWHEHALKNAERALKAFGFFGMAKPRRYTGTDSLFPDIAGFKPTPLQAWSEQAALPAGPQLFILEDVTGAGKTEAACILAQRLLASGHGEGLYFALPTMATSNAMYTRLGQLHRQFFEAEAAPSFVLAHGARELNDDFIKAVGEGQPQDLDYTGDERSASAQCNHWLADSRKKALLAEVGVGTIDQALMGVLPFRHQSLRLYGLARKVLILDEVHAYDAYMQGLLQTLLAYHARQGGSAILLTATLPSAMRRSLTDAWCNGLSIEQAALKETAFPLATQVCRDGYQEAPVPTRDSVVRSVAVDWLAEEDAAIEVILNAVKEGQSIAWVRNTVDDAIRAFEAIRARHPDPERCLLFHSRFAMMDRQRLEADVLARLGKRSGPEARRGQVLIATQVFQESLDCDTDVMISDLAPIDLLIQRAGRLQRHRRDRQGNRLADASAADGRASPRLYVLAPAWSEAPDPDWLKRALPGTQAVYRDVGRLWLTQAVLREQGGIRMPDDARALIEGVYGVGAEAMPDGLTNDHLIQQGDLRRQASMAGYTALHLEKGYAQESGTWGEEKEFGTRLSDEESVQIALLRIDADGELRLWSDAPRHAAMLSQLRLREGMAHKLAALPARWEPVWQVLQEREKGLRFVQPWLVESDGAYGYDLGYGLYPKGE